jgi:methylisocitrate lyase
LTPLFTVEELQTVNVSLALYPLSAFRAMNKAAELVFGAIRHDGTQHAVIEEMQTREELYERINYYEYERALDQYSGNGE